MDNDAKLRPLCLAKILYEQTDESNYLTTAQLIRILDERYNIRAHRQTIKADIDLLKRFGMDIQEVKSTQNRYNLVSRLFDIAELKLLIDAVESAKVIPANKGKDLVKKISSLAGNSSAATLRRNICCENRIRTNNEKILLIIDAVNEAINNKKKISFQYFKYNVRKEKQLRHEGQYYTLSPLHLVWNGDHYYIVGVGNASEEIICFRVDRIAGCPRILNEDSAIPPEGFNIDQFINTTFRMFNGDHEQVELICDNDVMDAVIDCFGEDVSVYAHDMTSFKAIVNVATSHIFYSWVFGFGGKVKIRNPKSVKEAYIELLNETFNNID